MRIEIKNTVAMNGRTLPQTGAILIGLKECDDCYNWRIFIGESNPDYIRLRIYKKKTGGKLANNSVVRIEFENTTTGQRGSRFVHSRHLYSKEHVLHIIENLLKHHNVI